MLKKTLKLILCLALAMTMLCATAVGASAANRVVEIHASSTDDIYSINEDGSITVDAWDFMEVLYGVYGDTLNLSNIGRGIVTGYKLNNLEFAVDVSGPIYKPSITYPQGEIELAPGTYIVQKKTTKLSFSGPSSVLSNTDSLEIKVYDQLTVSTNKADAGVKVNDSAVGENPVTVNVYRDTEAVIFAPQVANHTRSIASTDTTYTPDSDNKVSLSLTGDLSVSVNYAEETDSTINLNATDATVKANGENLPYIAKMNEKVTITAEPADGKYIADITVTDSNGNSYSDMSFADSSSPLKGSLAFSAGKRVTYTVSVTSKPVKLATNGNTVTYIKDLTDYAAFRSSVLNLIDADNCDPQIENTDHVIIEIGTTVLGNTSWNTLNASNFTYYAGLLFNNTDSLNIRLTYDKNNDQYPAASAIINAKLVDTRPATKVVLSSNTLTYTYGEIPSTVNDDILALVSNVVTTEDSQSISYTTGELKIDNKVTAASNAGEYTASVWYVGNALYQESEKAEITITVNKAPSSVSVDSKTVKYGPAYSASSMITTSPSGLDLIEFAAGVDLMGNSVIRMNLKIDSQFASLVAPFIPSEVDLGSLSSILNLVADNLPGMDNTALGQISGIISQITSLSDAFKGVKIQPSINGDMTFTESGVYLIGAVTIDQNYQTSGNAGYLVITPDAAIGQLGFDMIDENGFITRQAIQNGTFSFASHVKEEGLTENQHAVALSTLTNVFIGVKAEDGSPYIDKKPTDAIGVYTQIAFLDLSKLNSPNTAVVAMPIVRPYAVVPQNATVNVPNKTVAYGTEYTMDIAVYVGGKSVSQAKLDQYLTVNYIGLDTTNGTYNSTTPPTNVGVYSVVVTYAEPAATNARALDLSKLNNLGYFGAGIGTLTITPEGAFEITDTTVLYDGTEKFVDVTNPDNLEYIAFIRSEDGSELNIIFPDSWNAPAAKSEGIQSDKTAMMGWMDQILPSSVKASSLYAQLKTLLDKIAFDTLSINGAKPIEVGSYPITAIAYGANAGVITSEATLTITKNPDEVPEDPSNPGGEGGSTVAPEVEDALSNLPQTGDNSSVMLWIALLGVSAAAMVILLKRKANA